MEGRERSEGQSHKKMDRKEGVECGRMARGPAARDARLYLDICAPKVPSYTNGLKGQSTPGHTCHATDSIKQQWIKYNIVQVLV